MHLWNGPNTVTEFVTSLGAGESFTDVSSRIEIFIESISNERATLRAHFHCINEPSIVRILPTEDYNVLPSKTEYVLYLLSGMKFCSSMTHSGNFMLDVKEGRSAVNVAVEFFNADNSICPPVLYHLDHAFTLSPSHEVVPDGKILHSFECETQEILVSPNSACTIACRLMLNETSTNISVYINRYYYIPYMISIFSFL